MNFNTQNIGEYTFYEKINIKKLNYIINNPAKYEAIIKEQEKDMRRSDKHYNAFAVFQKIKQNVFIPKDLQNTDYAFLKITYKKGKSSNGIGRWYADKGIGIQPLCACVRHTICEDIWVDIDQVNSHPTIFKMFMDNYGFKSALLEECLNDRENFLKKIMKEEKCSRDTAKTYVIAIINGANYSSPTLKKLCQEIRPVVNHIINLSEYKYILDYVKSNYTDNIEGKTISRILQVLENNLLEHYLEFFNNKNLISKYDDGFQVSLIFDGFQLIKNDKINDELLNECRLYALEKTGYDIPLKIKPFDNQLSLPEDFNLYDDDDLLGLIDKYKIGLTSYIDKYKKEITECVSEEGVGHASISKLSKCIFKDTIVYDENSSLWFYCNINNIWKKSKTPLIYQGLLINILSLLFKEVAIHYNLLSIKATEEGEKELYTKKSNSALKITLKLKTASYLEGVVKTAKVDFNKSKFYETKIDSYGNLFAFKNKVLDCKALEIRNIKPDDYIMTNTGYYYPEYIDDKNKQIIEDYYKTIYPDKDIYEWIWNNDSLLLNGERLFQTFNIHTGSGSNSKSTKFAMLKEALGEYYCKINADTFTKPPKSANATSELYITKGKRMVMFNEPNDDTENKLQVPLLKELADGFKGTLKARGLYSEAVEFPIFFRVEGCCNDKPSLSSVDGGIARRLRTIDYPVKFVDNPDPNNPSQAKLNLEMSSILTSIDIRNTFIMMLIDRFINISCNIKTEIIPKKIQEDSNEYIEDSNVILGFILDRYDITNNEKDVIKSSELFNEFKIRNGSIKITQAKFKSDVCRINGISHKRLNSGVVFVGLKLKNDV